MAKVKIRRGDNVIVTTGKTQKLKVIGFQAKQQSKG